MITIHMGSDDNEIKHPSVYFNNTYLDEWFTDEDAKSVIKRVDNTDIVSANQMYNPT